MRVPRSLFTIATGSAVVVAALTLPASAQQARPAQPTVHSTPSSASTATRGAGMPALRAPDTTCVSNTTGDTGEAVVSQVFDSTYAEYDAAAAANIVPSADCTVTTVQVAGQYFNGSGPADSETVTFYADGGGVPGTVLNTQTVVGTDANGSFTIPIQSVSLTAGTSYWMSVQANMALETGGEWGWENTTNQPDTAAQWENPADGFGTGCTLWASMMTCTQVSGSDLMYTVSGSEVSGQTSQVFAGYELAYGKDGHGFEPIFGKTSTTIPGGGGGESCTGDAVWYAYPGDGLVIEYECDNGTVVVLAILQQEWDGQTALPQCTTCFEFKVAPNPGDTLQLTAQLTDKGEQYSVRDLTTGASQTYLAKRQQPPVQPEVGIVLAQGDTGPIDTATLTFAQTKLVGDPLSKLRMQPVTLVDAEGDPLATVSPIVKNGFAIESTQG